MLKKAQDIARIRRSIIFAAITFVAAIAMIFVGRSQQRTGQSLNELGIQRMERLQAEGRREREARKTAES